MKSIAGFSLLLYRPVEQLYQTHIMHSTFVREVKSGMLPQHVFNLFLVLDYQYLTKFSEAVREIYSKSEAAHQAHLSEIQAQTKAEHARLKQWLQRQSISLDEYDKVWADYGDHLYDAAQKEVAAVGLAAIFPCFLFFNEMGADFKRAGICNKNPYHDWMRFYAEASLESGVQSIASLINLYAEVVDEKTKDKMKSVFWISAQYEATIFSNLSLVMQ